MTKGVVGGYGLGVVVGGGGGASDAHVWVSESTTRR